MRKKDQEPKTEKQKKAEQQYKEFKAGTFFLRTYDKSQAFAFRCVFAFLSAISGLLSIILLSKLTNIMTIPLFLEYVVILFGFSTILFGIFDLQFLMAYAYAVGAMRFYTELMVPITKKGKQHQQEANAGEIKQNEFTEANQAITREVKQIQEEQKEINKDIQGAMAQMVDFVEHAKEVSDMLRKERELLMAQNIDVFSPAFTASAPDKKAAESKSEKQQERKEEVQKDAVASEKTKIKTVKTANKESSTPSTSISNENEVKSKYNSNEIEEYSSKETVKAVKEADENDESKTVVGDKETSASPKPVLAAEDDEFSVVVETVNTTAEQEEAEDEVNNNEETEVVDDESDEDDDDETVVDSLF